MPRIRLTILLLLIVTSCIEKYQPQYEKGTVQKYIVFGEITDKEGYQYITISASAPIDHPNFIPLTDCTVKVFDDNGNTFIFEEFEDGHYRSWITSNFLTAGTSYKLFIKTSAGIEIESDYDQMPTGPDVDTVYCELLNQPTNNPDKYIEGVQFYLDLKGAETDSRYYKWDLVETFEYHARFPIELYYDGKINKVIPPDYSRKICYQTQPVKNIFTINTSSFRDNSYKKLPLHYVDNSTQKLQHLYSLEIIQSALSEGAHNYWHQLQQNSTDQGGLFDRQPFNVTSNLRSIKTPKIKVIGYFFACKKTNKRFFYKDIPNLTFSSTSWCEPQKLEIGFAPYSPEDYPVYCVLLPDGFYGVADGSCFDCTLSGGTTSKPSFWPK